MRSSIRPCWAATKTGLVRLLMIADAPRAISVADVVLMRVAGRPQLPTSPSRP
jgi:hypothetical protein